MVPPRTAVTGPAAAGAERIGIRPGKAHALLATVTELGAGALLVAGLLTPLAAAGVVGTMAVALIANHRENGFFIFRQLTDRFAGEGSAAKVSVGQQLHLLSAYRCWANTSVGHSGFPGTAPPPGVSSRQP